MGRYIMDILKTEGCQEEKVDLLRRTVVIEGGGPLLGKLRIEGSKLSSIPILSASPLINETILLRNCPFLLDHREIVERLSQEGATIETTTEGLQIDCRGLFLRTERGPFVSPGEAHGLVYLYPGFLQRTGRILMQHDAGGCRIGSRSMRPMTDVFRCLGARVRSVSPRGIDLIEVSVPGSGLKGGLIDLYDFYGNRNNKYISCATKTALLASCVANGLTEIRGAWWGPPVRSLCDFLNRAGARITISDKRTIVVEGTTKLHGLSFEIPGDHLVLGTIIGALSCAGGSVCCTGATLGDLTEEANVFRATGVELTEVGNTVYIAANGNRRAIDITTETFSTDLAPILAASLCIAKGRSTIREVIWESRFAIVDELKKMGAKISVSDRTIVIDGVERLHSATLIGHDVRCCAAAVVAAISADGKTTIRDAHHLRRGYVDLIQSLSGIGVRIQGGDQCRN